MKYWLASAVAVAFVGLYARHTLPPKCTRCDDVFADRAALARHRKRAHPR